MRYGTVQYLYQSMYGAMLVDSDTGESMNTVFDVVLEEIKCTVMARE